MSNSTSKKTVTIYQLAFTGMMAAVVFATTAILQIPIVLPGAGKTMVSLANTMCLLSGFLLGPIYGGFAAGIGSFLYDLTDPFYASTAWVTFLFKFAMGFVCGLIAYLGRKKGNGLIKAPRRFTSAIVGAVTYMLLYLGKSYITLYLAAFNAGSEPSAAATLISIIPKILASSTNAILAVAISVPLSLAIEKALARTSLAGKIMQ